MTEHEIQTETPSQEGHIADCLKAIEDYRGKNISKWEAITQISTTIRLATASMDNGQRSTAGDTYIAMLDEHDRLFTGANSQGQPRDEPYDEELYDQQEVFSGEVGHK